MDAVIKFTPEKAWLAAKSQLQMDLSRSVFDTWVKPTSFISFDGGVFTIGCPNKACSEWVTNRLTTTLERCLGGILRQGIQIRFDLITQEEDKNWTNEEEVQQAPSSDQDLVELSFLHNSLRNVVLEPNRVVRMPVYFLRWLPYVQSQTIFLVIALWQEYYLSSEGKTGDGNNKVSARAEQVCQWAGISRAQFFRSIQPGGTLDWFVRKIDTDYELDRQTRRSKKSSNKYLLYDTPITPGDADDLKAYLISHGIQDAPIETLQSTLTVDPKEILCYPIREPSKNFGSLQPCHLTIHKVIEELLGHKLNTELSILTDQLADRLLARGEFILISWYFLKHWLPLLGSETAMFILILRNLCYFNDEKGEIRDEVWVEGGYEVIAKRLGIPNPRLVATWFPSRIERDNKNHKLSKNTEHEISRRKDIQDRIGLFIQRTDHRMNSSGCYAWKFKVQRADPLIPHQEIIFTQVNSFLLRCEEKKLQGELNTWINQVTNDCLAPVRPWGETVKDGVMHDFRLTGITGGCSETLKTILDDCFETIDWSANDCSETLLKILKNLKDTFINQDSSTHQDSSTSSIANQSAKAVMAVINAKGDWSLEKLLSYANKKNRQTLLDQEKDAQSFVSWVIYGVSQASIQNPYSLAIAKLKENPGIGAGRASESLASLAPKQLARLIIQELSFHHPSDKKWSLLFPIASHDRIRLLADTLGLVLETDDESVTDE
jgi:hypothetical protein